MSIFVIYRNPCVQCRQIVLVKDSTCDVDPDPFGSADPDPESGFGSKGLKKKGNREIRV